MIIIKIPYNNRLHISSSYSIEVVFRKYPLRFGLLTSTSPKEEMMIATSTQKKAVSKTQLLSNLLFLSLTNMCPQMTLKSKFCLEWFVADVTDIRSTLYRVNKVMLWYLIFMDLHVSFETSRWLAGFQTNNTCDVVSSLRNTPISQRDIFSQMNFDMGGITSLW